MVKNWPRTDGPNIDTICTSIRRPMFKWVITGFSHLLVVKIFGVNRFTSAWQQHQSFINHCQFSTSVLIIYFLIISVSTVGQCTSPSGLHHINEEEKSRWRASTEAPSALQSHLLDTEGGRERNRESGGRRMRTRPDQAEGGMGGEGGWKGGRCCLEKGRE